MNKKDWKISVVAILGMVAVMGCMFSCNKHRNDAILAKAYNNYLYESDIADLVGEGIPPEDSIVIVNNYINQWIQQMVVLEHAKHQVKHDFSKELQNYKNSLLTYEYERNVIEEKLDTSVSEKAVEEFYKTNAENFSLNTNILKMMYVKLPKGSPAVGKLRALMSHANISENDMMEIQKLASMHGQDYYFNIDTWIPFYQFQAAVPVDTYNEQGFLRNNSTLVAEDKESAYVCRILSYKLEGETAPLEYEFENVKSIILNRRKIDIIKDMQRNLLKEAEKDKKIEIINTIK